MLLLNLLKYIMHGSSFKDKNKWFVHELDTYLNESTSIIMSDITWHCDEAVWRRAPLNYMVGLQIGNQMVLS